MAIQSSMTVGTDDFKAALAELIATTLFIFVGVGSIAAMIAADQPDAVVLIALAHGLAIALLAAGAGPLSGGHINPAVTFAMLITGKISLPRAGLYVVAQLVGASIGALLLKLVLEGDLIDAIPGAGGHAVNTEALKSTGSAYIMEAILTFVLVWTIFATAVNPKGPSAIAPLAIGFAVLVIHLVAIPFTGAGVNPARTFGPALIFGEWDDHLVYWVGPLVGAAAAGLTYWMVYLSKEEG